MKATIRGRMLLAPLLALVASSAFAAGDTAVRLPLLYDSFLPPAAGQIYADQAFGTKIKRLSDAVNTPNHATTGNLLWIGTEYPTASPFNANNSWLILQHQGYFGLYDGSGTYVRDLPFSVNASTEPRWSRTDPNVLFYVKGNKLMRLDVSAGTSTTIRTFSEYSAIRGRGESDISRDGDHFVFAGDAPGGLANRYVFVYQISTNTKGAVLDTIGHAFNQLYLAPDNSVALGWLTNGTTRFTGIELFDRNMNFQRQLTHAIGHMHLTRDTNGADVLVWTNSGDPQPIPNCNNGIVKVRLSNAHQTCLLQLDYSLAVHITAGDGDGWVFVETYAPIGDPPATLPGWKPYMNEILQVKLDGTLTRRLLHHRSRLTANYEYQPRATISRDGTTLVYSSTYNLQGTSGHAFGYTDVYLAAVPGAPPPRISIADASVLEGNGGTVNLDFTVRLSHLSAETVTVQFQALDGTATAAADYGETGLQTLTFPPFTAALAISVAVIGDTVIEPDETLRVVLSNPTNADITGPSGLGTITNDDLPTLSIGDVSITEGNSGQVLAVFAITLSAPIEKLVSVTAATANNTALSGSDYTAAGPSIVTFAAGVTSQNFAVPILGDNLHESNETFFVNLSGPGNATILDAQGVGTILNDDAVAPLSLSINTSPVAEGNTENGVQAFTVSLSASSLSPVTVNYATANGTATSGSDYVSRSGTLTIPPGFTTGTIAVAILGDTTDEPDETYFVNLSGATNAVIVDPQAMGTILDDDVPLMKIESFTASPAFVAIGGCSTLAWSVTGTGTVTLQGTIVGPMGSQLVCPTQTTTYGLATASGFGNTSSIATVSVNNGTAGLAAPTVTLPGSGQVVGATGVGFAWTGVGGAGGYDLRVLDGSTGVLFFSGSLLGAGSTSTLITLPSGNYIFAVRGCVGGFADSQCGAYGTVPFTVSPAAPAGVPTVTFPTEGAKLSASTQTFSWTAVTPNPALSGLTYEVVLRDLGTGTTALQITVPSPNLSTIFTMKSSILYELKVRACQAGCGPYSAPVRFSVSLPPVPTVAPSGVGCSVSGGNSMTCNWSTVTNADAYQVQVVQAPPAGPGGGALTVAAKQVSATTVTLPVPSGNATVFIAACNGNGCGPYATTAITAAGPNPAQANIGTPMAGTVVSGPGLLFTWNRVPGDNGSNTSYRLFVQDLSRQGTALDVFTTNNFYPAFLKAEGSRYDVLVVSNPGTPGQTQGPSQGFNVSGSSATSPTLVSPPHNSLLPSGNIQLGWSRVPGATLYEYYVAVLGQGNASARGVTAGLLAQVPLSGGGAGTLYSGIVRACPQGTTCAPGSDTGWGPWSNTAGGPGVTNFTVTP